MPRLPGWPPAKRSRLLLNIVTVLVTLVFSYIALSEINLSLAWHALRTSDLAWIAASLIPFGLGNLARALRWRSLFARGRRPGAGAVTDAMMVGYLYNNILPARVGEAARVVVLTQRSNAPPVEIVGTVLVERLYDVVTLLVIFFAAEPWLPHVSWFGAAAVAAVVLAALIIAVATLLAVYGDRPVRVLLRPLRRLSLFSGERLERTIDEVTHGLSGLRHGGIALEAFAWSVAAWLHDGALCLLRQPRLPPARPLLGGPARGGGDRTGHDPPVRARRRRHFRGGGADRAARVWRPGVLGAALRGGPAPRQLRAVHPRRRVSFALQRAPSEAGTPRRGRADRCSGQSPCPARSRLRVRALGVGRVLITGGAGFIGASVGLELAARHPDWEIVALDNLHRRGAELNLARLRDGGVRFVHGDVREPDDLRAVDGFDALVECSAEPSVMAGVDGATGFLVRTNLLGAYHCLEEAARHRAQILFLSTSRVYPVAALNSLSYVERETRFELTDDQPLTGASAHGVSERFPLEGARTLYGASKLCRGAADRRVCRELRPEHGDQPLRRGRRPVADGQGRPGRLHSLDARLLLPPTALLSRVRRRRQAGA